MGWKIATGVLAAALIAQFFWWDAQAPQVLRSGGYLPATTPPR